MPKQGNLAFFLFPASLSEETGPAVRLGSGGVAPEKVPGQAPSMVGGANLVNLNGGPRYLNLFVY